MPSLMVYTEEIFYYGDHIHVVARQEFANQNVTSLAFYNEFGFWFGMEIEDSLYSSNEVEPVLACELKRYGHCPEFQYSRKHLEYSYSDKRVLDTVDFYITETERKDVLAVMEQLNHLLSVLLMVQANTYIQKLAKLQQMAARVKNSR